jgi:hypothetical protein
VTPGKAVLFTVVLLAALGVWALVRRMQRARDLYDEIAAPEPVYLPANMTCLRCCENPALPDRPWCAVCAEVVDTLPVEPIDQTRQGGEDR